MPFGGEKGSGLVLASRLVYDPTAEPIFRPAASGTFLNTSAGTTTTVTRRLVYDQTTGPVLPPTAAIPFTFVNPPPDGVRSRKRPSPILPSSFVFAIPVDDLGWQIHDQPFTRKKQKILSDNPVPLPVPVALPTISSTLTSTSSGNTVIPSRMVYDQTAAPIFGSAAVVTTPAAFGYPPDEGQKKRTSRLILQGIERSVGPPSTAVVTPSVYGYQPADDQRKRKPRLLLESIERSLGPSAAGAAIAFGYQAADCPRVKPVRRVSEAFATFVNPPAVIPTPPNPVEPPHGHFLKNEIRRITSLQRG